MSDEQKGLTSRDSDYSQWYLDVIAAADMADYSPVKGCMVIKPWGYAIWENIQKILNDKSLLVHIPELLMPQTGPAQGRYDFTNLKGLYKLVVTKQDKTVNEFSVNISPTAIDIKHKPRAPFILISSDPASLS